MNNDDNFRIDMDRNEIAKMMMAIAFNEMFPSGSGDASTQRLVAIFRVFAKHGISLPKTIDILKDLDAAFDDIDKEEK